MSAEPPVDLTEPRHFHLVAVGGKAMGPMAELLVAMGHRVSGSDQHDGPELDHLRGLGVEVFVGHDAANVGNADVVACSTAVAADNVERVAAASLGITMLTRQQLQGAIARTRRPIAVSGTHGKTSTTAMLTTIMTSCGLDPSYLVGGKMGAGLGTAHLGTGPWFVMEADESDGTFLELGAEIAVVTNVDADHLDLWGSLDALEAGFDRFLAEASGPTVVCADDPVAARLGQRHGSVTVGVAPTADWRIVECEVGRGVTRFGLVNAGREVGRVELPEPGLHNAQNATAALVAAHLAGAPIGDAVEALRSYPGLERRFQTLGEAGGVTIVDDFAHNPAKVAAVLKAAADGGWTRVVAVFQPHRVSRTADLHAEFADCFIHSDSAWITELDPSGETLRPGVSGSLIVDAVRAAHPDHDVRWIPDQDSLTTELVDFLRPGDLCITIGAGDITELGPRLLDALGGRDT